MTTMFRTLLFLTCFAAVIINGARGAVPTVCYSCLNGATCDDSASPPMCVCAAGFQGMYCEETFFCPSPFEPFSDRCLWYPDPIGYLVERIWTKRTECVREGGDIARMTVDSALNTLMSFFASKTGTGTAFVGNITTTFSFGSLDTRNVSIDDIPSGQAFDTCFAIDVQGGSATLISVPCGEHHGILCEWRPAKVNSIPGCPIDSFTVPSLPDQCFTFNANPISDGSPTYPALTYDRARLYCQSQGGELVPHPEQPELFGELMRRTKNYLQSAYVGLRPYNEAGPQYSNNVFGEKLPFGINHYPWESAALSEDGLCVSMWIDSGEAAGFYDTDCDTELPYVCGFRKDEDSVLCPPPFIKYGSRCFYSDYTTTKTRNSSSNLCNDNGGQTVRVGTPNLLGDAATFIREFFVDYDVWTDAEINGRCATLPWTSIYGDLQEDVCGHGNKWLCEFVPWNKEIERTGNCPANAVAAKNIPFRCFTFHTVSVDFVTARQQCRANGGDLAMSVDYKSFQDLVKSQPASPPTYWIGVLNPFDHQSFRVDGTRMAAWNFNTTLWKLGQPNNDDEKCLVIEQTSGLLQDKGCKTAYPYICEYTTEVYCPYPFVAYESRCLFLDMTTGTFDAQRATCQARGGELALVDYDGQDQVKAFLQDSGYTSNAFIGLVNDSGIVQNVYEFPDSPTNGVYMSMPSGTLEKSTNPFTANAVCEFLVYNSDKVEWCPPTWDSFPHHPSSCSKRMTGVKKFAHARRDCQQNYNGDLFMGLRSSSWLFYEQEILNSGNPTFVGLLDDDNTIGTWLDGTMEPLTQPFYGSGEPSSLAHVCGVLYQTGAVIAAGDADCSVASEYICQARAKFWCPTPYTQYRGRCLYAEQTNGTIAQMSNACALNAGTIARAHTHNLVYDLIDFLNYIGDYDMAYFIGVGVLAGKKASIDELISIAVPDTCFQLTSMSWNFVYQAANCSEHSRAVCEFRHLLSNSPAVSIPGMFATDSLPDTTLYAPSMPAKPFDTSRAYCQSIGGDLATVMYDEDAMDWIKATGASSSAWVGIVDLDFPFLLTGLPLEYTFHDPWAPSQPNSATEKCGLAFMSSPPDSGKVNDAFCNTNARAICQFQPEMSYAAYDTAHPYHPLLRLSQTINTGFVEVFTTLLWKQVCISDINAAQVVCRQLGHSGGQLVSQLQTTTARIWNVICAGDEDQLGWCQLVLGVNDVACLTTSILCTADVSLQTATGGESGDLQVYDATYDQPFAVCNTSFDANDAFVACRSLGYNVGVKVVSVSGLQDGIISDLQCTGTETSIANCGIVWLPLPQTCFPAAVKCTDPRAAFHRTRIDGGPSRLMYHILDVQQARSFLDCSLSCMEAKECKSFNYNSLLSDDNCELNDQTHIQDPDNFVSDTNDDWLYSQKTT